MKTSIKVTLFAAISLLIFTTYKTFFEREVYSAFLAPLAILTSALIAILTAILSLEKNESISKLSRTFDFVVKEYPFTKEILENVVSGQKKLVLGSKSIIKKRISKNEVEINMDEAKKLLNSLSHEERFALGKVTIYYEYIAINLKNDIFSKELVSNHLGKDYGLFFWSSAWPLIILWKHFSSKYFELKGLPKSKNSDTYTFFEEHILKIPEVMNPYPCEGEKITDEYPH